ncbi:MAG: (Fe-S)-binding protein, partial [Bacillota bacterium]|nr:(Fe-S)-binding protein [Bacillota bacterium]
GKAVYHHNCHTQRFLKVKEQPLKLLSKVEGLELVDFHNSNKCCGFGGTFSVKMGEISAEVADEKARYIQEANPDYLIGADYACLMNIGGRLSRLGSNIKVMHLAEVLNSK